MVGTISGSHSGHHDGSDFWNVPRCNRVEACRHLGWTYYLFACLTYSSTLKMEVVQSSETYVHFYQTVRRHIIATTVGTSNGIMFMYGTTERVGEQMAVVKSTSSLMDWRNWETLKAWLTQQTSGEEFKLGTSRHSYVFYIKADCGEAQKKKNPTRLFQPQNPVL
jgi:hypothetical protein